jgi:hypothetical protein
MADTQIDIEAIVRQVVKQLLCDSPDDAGGQARSGECAGRVGDSQVVRTEAGVLEIAERVVTWAGLKDRLTGVQRLIVPAGAVLTPSVRDELRRRNIACQVASRFDHSAGAPGTTLLIATSCGEHGAQPAIQAIEAEAVGAARIGSGALADMIQQLRQRIDRDQAPGVLLTTAPAAAVCLANRYGRLRAVWGTEPAVVEESCRSVGANLLVLDPRHHPPNQLRSMVRQFLRGNHQCPATWQTVLAGETPS